MRIGIISINIHTKVLNFASPLHSVAFQQFLKQHGIDSTIIDYKPNYYGKFDVRHPLDYYREHPEDDPILQQRLLKKWETLYAAREKRFDRFEEFVQTYYKKTKRCHSAKKLDERDLGYDCYICATDVIWKHSKKSGFDRGFFLACKSMEGKKKIAYAASRGASRYTSRQAKDFFNYISDIDYISVREKSLMEYIKEHSDLSVSHVLDPVFLQEKPFYEEMAIHPQEKNYILIYLAMEKADSLVKTAIAFAREHGFSVIELSEYPDHEKLADGVDYKLVYDIGVEEWLGYMLHAKYIFTNSFHACCFSVIFQKQFYAGARAGDKIDSVLDLFELSNRRVKGYNPKLAQSLPDIDFGPVEDLRRQYVKASSDFILNAIQEIETGEHQNHRHLVHDEVYNAQKTLSEIIAENPFFNKAYQKGRNLYKVLFRH